MRNVPSTRRRLIFAARTVGSFTLLAVVAQSAFAPSSAKTAIHKPSTTKAAHSSSSAGKKPTSSKSSSKRKSKKVKGQTAPTPERINEIQGALAKKGALDGAPTGKWDDSTSDAVRRFQSSNGLNPTGKLDALTLQKLGLGSETAGLAAPTPPPNSVNRLRNTTSLPAEPQEPDSESHN